MVCDFSGHYHPSSAESDTIDNLSPSVILLKAGRVTDLSMLTIRSLMIIATALV